MLKKFVIFCLCTLAVGYLVYVPILKPFPKPTGNYAIGTTFVQFPHETTPLTVRFFYPTQLPTNGKEYVYLHNTLKQLAPKLALEYHAPTWLIKLLLSNIKTHAYSDAPVAKDKTTFPVILFSHGLLGAFADMYTYVYEELASHGYIVAAIDHPTLSFLSQKLEKPFIEFSAQEQKEFQKEATKKYTADHQFVMDELKEIHSNPNSLFFGKLNLNSIIVAGHSGGGTAAVETCRLDERCKAVINLDGWFDHVISWEPLKKPALLLFAGKEQTEIPEPTPDYLKRKELTRKQYFERERTINDHKKALCASEYCAMVYLPNVKHGDFTDTVLFKWPLCDWHAENAYKLIDQIKKEIISFLAKQPTQN